MPDIELSYRTRRWIEDVLVDPVTKQIRQPAVDILADWIKKRSSYLLHDGWCFGLYRDGDVEYVVLTKPDIGCTRYSCKVGGLKKCTVEGAIIEIVKVVVSHTKRKELIFGM